MASVEHCLFCFETLVANLEQRTPLILDEVISSWAEYPKGLEDDDNESADEPSAVPSSSKRRRLDHLAPPRTASSTPASTSSASSNSTTQTSATPPSSSSSATHASSTTSFVPIGIGRKTSQRAGAVTESPLFVTWNKASASSGRYSLRGCIGTFETLALTEGLAQYALIAALHDTRFEPITRAELPRLQVGVTLLTDFEPCADPMDWTLGVHGLRISFFYHHRRFGSTYLPDVAVEQGWTKEECLISLMKKAGWSGKREKWMEVADLKVTRYQGKVESVDYDEYKRWRDWVDARDNK